MRQMLFAGAAAMAIIVGQANAQPTDPETDSEDVDVISVYATRNPLPAFDYAGQVTVIERDVILDFNPSALSDVFAAIPGAQFDSGPRRTGDAPSVRGLTGNGVLIFLDGARQSFVSGHDGRLFVDPELVQAVEVVRGPTSALYGSGALGGVIATRTITARDFLDEGDAVGFRLNSGYQSVNDEFRVGGTGVWQSEDGLLDVVGHLTYRSSGDIDLGNDATLPADDEILSSLLKLTVRPTDDLELFASYIRYNADSTDPQNPQGVNIAGPTNELVFRDAENTTLQGGFTWNPASDLINFNFVGYYSDNAVEEDEVENPRTTDRQVETFGLTIDNRSRFTFSDSAAVTFTYGGEYYNDSQTGLDTDTADGTRGGVPNAETDFIGLFVQADFEFANLGFLPGQINIVPGFRWDDFETSSQDDSFTIDESQVSPKVGVSYKPVPQLLIFGNYAEGFRAPSFN
ncbi:MAG: TonB-dependent receptor, partial [Pseudomonadota bacterium]